MLNVYQRIKTNNIHIYVISFLLALIGIGVLAALKGVTPFGEGTFAVMDANIQYIDYFGYLQDVLKGKQDILYSFNKSLGGTNFVVLSFYLISPFSLLVVFFEKSSLMTFFTLAVALKLATSALSFSVFLKHRFDSLDNKIIIVLSTCYGLMHYNMAQLSNIEFLDGVYMLPFILLGVYKLIRDDNKLLLIIAVAVSMVFSWYTGAINCIASAVWLLYELILANNGKMVKTILKYALCMIIGIGISMCIFLPTVLAMQGGRAGIDWFVLDSFDISNGLSFIKGICSGVLGEKEHPGLFSGSIVFIGVIGLLVSRYSSLKERILDIALIIFVYLMMYCPIVVFVFSLLKDVDSYWYRYGYVFLFILIFCAAKYFDKLATYDNMRRMSLEMLLGFALYTAVNVMVFIIYHDMSVKRLILSVGISLVIVICLIIYYGHSKKVLALVAIGFLCLVNIAELVYSGKGFVGAGETEYKDYIIEQSNQIESIKEYDSSDQFYRISQDDTRLQQFMKYRLTANYNDGLVYNYPSIVSYTSDPENIMRDFMDSVGYRSNGKNINVVNTCNLAVDSFLGVKYELMRYSIKGLEEVEEIGEANKKRVFENPYVLPVAFVVNDGNLIHKDYRTDNVFENVNNIYSDILGEKVSLYEPVTYDKRYDKKEIDYILSCYNVDYPLYGNIVFSHENPSVVYENDVLITEYNQWLAPSVFPIFSREDRTNIKVVPENLGEDITDSTGDYFYQLNLNKLKEVTDIIKGNNTVENVIIQNGRISISLFSDSEKELLLTIPYEEGWKATNNGEDTRIDKAFNCFMTIKLKPGTNNIEITYTVRGLYLGIVISIISVILCAVIGIIDSRRRQKKGAI